MCFAFHASQSVEFVYQALGLKPAANAVLVTDGYGAYEQCAQKIGITHARCWSHGRRGFFEALVAEPTGAAEALGRLFARAGADDLTGALFAQWSIERRHPSPKTLDRWQLLVRMSCRYRRRDDPRCFVPDPTGFA